MELLNNPHRHVGLNVPILNDIPAPSIDAAAPQALLRRCPDANITPLIAADAMAQALNLGQISIKDERQRMGMGSFKALGAAYVIAHRAVIEGEDQSSKTYVTASAGNHGLSVAAGAQAFGARACITLPNTVPEAFATRLASYGAQVIRAGDDYAASLATAMDLARTNGWELLSDTSWSGYSALPHRLMEGYTTFMAETHDQISAPPTHIFLQAGVGGLAGAAAAMARALWGDNPIITVVEPANAPALWACIQAGDYTAASGPDSCMGRLDCKEASLIALKGLAHDSDFFALISEDEGIKASAFVGAHAMPSTPSGAGGLAGVLHSAPHRAQLGLNDTSHILLILSEGPE